MKPLIHVPHRGKLPTTQFARTGQSDSEILESSPNFDVAMEMTYEERQCYAGFPDVQHDILQQSIDDFDFADEVTQAASRIAEIAVVSPIFEINNLQVKDESQQLTRAYKIRGATNFIAKHLELANRAGVVTASAGNHGQGVALAAGKVGISALVVVPEGTPTVKTDGIREYGGEVVEYGQDYAAANRRAIELNQERNGLYVPAYNHRDIMAGQATIGLELLTQTPDMTDLYVPTGGGGLLAGLSKYLATAMPSVRVWGCGVENSSTAVNAFKYGNSYVTSINKFADGIAVERLGSVTWPEIHRHSKGALEVNEDLLRKLVGSLSLQGHTYEGAGTVGIAAAMQHGTSLGKRQVALATGGNIDKSTLLDCQKIAGNTAS